MMMMMMLMMMMAMMMMMLMMMMMMNREASLSKWAATAQNPWNTKAIKFRQDYASLGK